MSPSRRTHRSVAQLLPIAVVLTLASPPAATPGDLDPSFGSGGWVVTHFGGPAYPTAADIAIQSDGKIVVAGTAFNRFALARYSTDGALDASFGGDGKSTVSFKPGRSSASTLSLQSDGSVGGGPRGQKRYVMAVARLLPDGSPDPSFGVGGTARVRFGASVNVLAVEVLANGDIMLAAVDAPVSEGGFRNRSPDPHRRPRHQFRPWRQSQLRDGSLLR